MPDTLIQDQSMWSGSLQSVLFVAIPMAIAILSMVVLRELGRSGASLVPQVLDKLNAPDDATPDAATPVPGPDDDVDEMDNAGRAKPYDGFDPDLYGPAPAPATTDPGGDPTVTA